MTSIRPIARSAGVASAFTADTRGPTGSRSVASVKFPPTSTEIRRRRFSISIVLPSNHVCPFGICAIAFKSITQPSADRHQICVFGDSSARWRAVPTRIMNIPASPTAVE